MPSVAVDIEAGIAAGIEAGMAGMAVAEAVGKSMVAEDTLIDCFPVLPARLCCICLFILCASIVLFISPYFDVLSKYPPTGDLQIFRKKLAKCGIHYDDLGFLWIKSYYNAFLRFYCYFLSRSPAAD